MIRGIRASLSIHSDTKPVADIAAMLGPEPTVWGDRGDLTPAGRAGRNYAPERLTHQRTFWSLTDSIDGPSGDDQTGFSALRALVVRLEPTAQAVVELRQGGETRLWWSGDSGNTKGGFVLEADLISSLATLGCGVIGTAYLAVNKEDEDSMSSGDVVEFRIGNTSGVSK